MRLERVPPYKAFLFDKTFDYLDLVLHIKLYAMDLYIYMWRIICFSLRIYISLLPLRSLVSLPVGVSILIICLYDPLPTFSPMRLDWSDAIMPDFKYVWIIIHTPIGSGTQSELLSMCSAANPFSNAIGEDPTLWYFGPDNKALHIV